MAITDKKPGVWGLDQVYNKENQGSIWTYSGIPGLFVTGYNNQGQLGLNNTTDYSSPVQIPGTTWEYVSTRVTGDTYHMLATKTDGTIWSWGNNSAGQLGHNNTTTCSSPVQIPGSTWGAEMERSGTSSYAIKTDGTLWSWGNNSPSYGELGHNNKTNYSSPKQVGTEETWSKISSGGYFVITTKTDGTMWNWGAGPSGRLGINNTTDYSSPKQVPGTTWTGDISTGGQYGGAIKTDGTLWVWGVNEYGMLGQNSKTNYSSPRQVGSETTWSKIGFAKNSAFGVKTDGTLWSWGANDVGILGQNQAEPGIAAVSSPVQVPGTTWDNVVGVEQYVFATKTDGSLWAWGNNSQGRLGVNNTTHYSSPVQVPGDWRTGDRKIGGVYLSSAFIANI